MYVWQPSGARWSASLRYDRGFSGNKRSDSAIKTRSLKKKLAGRCNVHLDGDNEKNGNCLGHVRAIVAATNDCTECFTYNWLQQRDEFVDVTWLLRFAMTMFVYCP